MQKEKKCMQCLKENGIIIHSGSFQMKILHGMQSNIRPEPFCEKIINVKLNLILCLAWAPRPMYKLFNYALR